MASSNYGYSNHTKGITDDHASRIGSLESDNTAEKAKVVTLQSEMSTVQGEITALEAAVNKSDSNDDAVKSALLSVVSYLDNFSESYTLKDSNGDDIVAPDWSAITTALNALQDHEIS